MRAKATYTIFCLAALLFVAKPFIGFSIANFEKASIATHNLLAKSFSKRKPEDLEEAQARAKSIHRQLTNPALPLLLTITSLLGLLFPFIFKPATNTANSFLNKLKTSLIPVAQPYLLAGKLII